MINWDYAGLIYYNDMWFYVSGGTINWDYADLYITMMHGSMYQEEQSTGQQR